MAGTRGVHGPGPDRRRVWAAGGIVGEMVVLVLLTVWVFPDVWRVSQAVIDEDQSAGPELGVTLSELVDHPEPMWGATVTVSALVAELIDPRTMLIGNDDPIVGDKALVVGSVELSRLLDQPGAPIAEGDVARVTGVVRRFDIPSLEADLGVDLDDAGLAGYGRSSVLVAGSVRLDPPPAVGAGDPEYGGSAGPEIGVTVRDIHDHPERYVGRRVTVSGEVEGTYGPHAAWVRDVGVLVVRREARPAWFDEASALVTGEVRRFDRRVLAAELGVPLDDPRLAALGGGPVIVASSVEVIT